VKKRDADGQHLGSHAVQPAELHVYAGTRTLIRNNAAGRPEHPKKRRYRIRRKRRKSPGGNHVEGILHILHVRLYHHGVRKAQHGHHVSQEAGPPAGPLYQAPPDAGQTQGQRHAGQAGAGAHVRRQARTFRCHRREAGKRVQHVAHGKVFVAACHQVHPAIPSAQLFFVTH